ncbi:MAG TPA: zf-HC2 domain-containing protein, partial [Thermoanaerobaculia bacterium]|nr:zf-HC2 domain-containing protein [Thermoanaerobaculia bacterium]
MAAFLDGALEQEQVAEVAAHLRECAECRLVAAESARFEREEAASQPARTKWVFPTWAAAAAVLVAIAIAAIVSLRAGREAAPIARLIALAPREHRLVQPRLSGFAWARLQPPARGAAPPDPADLKFAGAAGEVLEKTAGVRDADSLHARGVAYLLIGRGSDAIATLERAAAAADDQRIRNDLAAARLGISDEHPSQLPRALGDVDGALKLDPKFAEARFNRALILEKMNLRDAARKAWQQYLALDAAGPWSVEAR